MILMASILVSAWYNWSVIARDVQSFFSRQLGFQLQSIVVTGHHHIRDKVIRQSLHVGKKDPIWLVDPWQVRQSLLENLPWIKSATVQRRWPNQLKVHVRESFPIAHWQHKKENYLINDSGKPLRDHEAREILRSAPLSSSKNPKETKGYFKKTWEGLLTVTGEDAPRATPKLINILKAFPVISRRVTGAMYVGGRRWDVMLDAKIRVKLPRENMDKAFVFLREILNASYIDLQNVQCLDLRDERQAYIRYASPPVKASVVPQPGKKA